MRRLWWSMYDAIDAIISFLGFYNPRAALKHPVAARIGWVCALENAALTRTCSSQLLGW